MTFSAEALRASLGRGYPAGAVLSVLPETGSTNRDAKAMAEAGAPSGSIALAARQSAGRGRFTRVFSSPDGGLYFSMLLRPRLPSATVPTLTAAAAVAAAAALEALCPPLAVSIKWVNDLFAGGRKLGGILAEGRLGEDGQRLDYLVIGIGINLRGGNLPPELSAIATSVEAEGASPPSPILLAAEIAKRLLAYAEGEGDFLAEYRRRQLLLGRRVEVSRGDERFFATCREIAGDCSLVVSLDSGERMALSSGEVSLGSGNFARGAEHGE